MKRRGSVTIPDVLLLIGLAMAVVALVVALAPRSGPWLPVPSTESPLPARRLAAVPVTPAYAGSGGREVTAASLEPPHAMSPASPAGRGDARIPLREAEAMARWYPGVWSRQGETRTDLWINAPLSIGSTSPPDAGPATPGARD